MYIYVNTVCLYQRERERERDRQTDRQTDSQTDRQTEKKRGKDNTIMTHERAEKKGRKGEKEELER